MDRYHSSAIFKGSSIMYKIPITTQHDARQRCPALIVLKEENNNNNNGVTNVEITRNMALAARSARAK